MPIAEAVQTATKIGKVLSHLRLGDRDARVGKGRLATRSSRSGRAGALLAVGNGLLNVVANGRWWETGLVRGKRVVRNVPHADRRIAIGATMPVSKGANDTFLTRCTDGK